MEKNNVNKNKETNISQLSELQFRVLLISTGANQNELARAAQLCPTSQKKKRREQGCQEGGI